jgi:RimJ/RimL family protein N-acetyltransferase
MSAPEFNPILLDLPDHIDTERLHLRAPRPGDGAVVNASVLETLDDLRRFPSSMSWALTEQTVATSEEYCRRSAAGWLLRDSFPFLAFERAADGAIGRHVVNCGIHRFSWKERVFEIGWWCPRSAQGNGYASEAARALIAFAFEHLGARRVWAGADDANVKSWRVAERAGMTHEGTLRSERADPDGTRRDMRIYAVAGDRRSVIRDP